MDEPFYSLLGKVKIAIPLEDVDHDFENEVDITLSATDLKAKVIYLKTGRNVTVFLINIIDSLYNEEPI